MATGKTTKRTFTGRKSKVDQVAHLVGKVSDRELAQQIGVTPENVRTWRKRRGIDAAWKTDEAAAAPAPAPKAKPKRKKKRKGKGASRRKSKLDPWFSQLGAVPDRQIAEQANVTPENVRAYRKRHGIPSSWRVEATDDAATQASPAPAAKAKKKPAAKRTRKQVAKPVVATVAPATKPRRRSASTTATRGWAFRVTADVDGTEREYVTFGADVVEAAQVARDRLAATKSSAHIKKIEVVGVAL